EFARAAGRAAARAGGLIDWAGRTSGCTVETRQAEDQQRPRVFFSFPIRRMALSERNSSSCTRHKRHVGRPPRLRSGGRPHRTHGLAGSFRRTHAPRARSFLIEALQLRSWNVNLAPNSMM